MNRTDLGMALGIAGAALALTLGGMSLAPASADGDRFEHRDEARHDHEHQRGGSWLPRLAVAPLDPTYREECGACHMAYPPVLLPAASWDRIMSGLDDHFGDNAELDARTREQLLGYLSTTAREGDGSWAAHKLRRGLDESSAPLPTRRSSDLGSLFDEDRVRIAGYGKWDD